MKIKIQVLACITGLLSMSLSHATPFNVSASQDTYITEHDGYGGPNTPQGANNLVLVRAIPGLHRTYPIIAFDVTSAAGQTIVGPTVDFTLDVRSAWGMRRVTQSISIRESLVGWDEATATYANFGGVGFSEQAHTGANLTTKSVTFNGVTEPVTFSIDSSIVQRWIDNPALNNGLFLVSNTSATLTDMSFWSKEQGNAPQLSFEAIPEPLTAAMIFFLLPLFILRRNVCVGAKQGTGSLYLKLNKFFSHLYVKNSHGSLRQDKWGGQ